MNRNAFIALGALVIIAAAGAYALRSIDQTNAEVAPLPTAKASDQQAESPPAPRLPDETSPPKTPDFEAERPVFPVLCGTYLTVPPRPMHSEQGCKDEANLVVPQVR